MDEITAGVVVRITDAAHPWHGHTGKIMDRVKTGLGEMWRVRLDNGWIDVGCREDQVERVGCQEHEA